jgi:hypothetical protein
MVAAVLFLLRATRKIIAASTSAAAIAAIHIQSCILSPVGGEFWLDHARDKLNIPKSALGFASGGRPLCHTACPMLHIALPCLPRGSRRPTANRIDSIWPYHALARFFSEKSRLFPLLNLGQGWRRVRRPIGRERRESCGSHFRGVAFILW